MNSISGNRMKRVFAIAAIVDLAFLSLALYTRIKDFLFVHPWLLSALAAAPAFPKDGNVFHVEYMKPASPERRRLDVFESAEGKNSYMLVTSSGEMLFGDNFGISRQSMLKQLEYEAEGFSYNGGGWGGSKYPLFMKTRT